MATLSRELSLSALSSMPKAERQMRISELIDAVRTPSQHKIGEWLDKLNKQISAYEEKYELSSNDMKNMVELGEMDETNDVCDWLKLLGKRNRFESRQSKTSTHQV